jgi:flagellar hook-associated protein 2
MKLVNPSSNPDVIPIVKTGDTAQFTINNMSLESSSNQYTIAGTTMTFAKESASAIITVSPDTDSIYNAIKSFVDTYNDTLDTVKSKMNEKRYDDFPPLTADERKELSDDDVKTWEEKAKSGLLKNDTTLKEVSSKMRMNSTSAVLGLVNKYTSLAQIGITTGAIGSSSTVTESGKLYIDEDKLKDAINNNQDAVVKLFTYADSSTKDNLRQGILERLGGQLNTVNTYIRGVAGDDGYLNVSYTLGRNMNSLASQISEMEEKLSEKENDYYDKFSKLETLMNKMNMYSSQFTSMYSS